MSQSTGHAGAHHDPHLAHHFESPAQQYQSARLGMWVFLVTEILFFGGLFCAYAVYRANHPEIFIFGHHFLDTSLGALNTVVLIFSSFTIAWAVRAAQLKQIRLLKLLLGLTLLCAFTFLGVKYVEYSHKWHAGLLWARSYAPQAHHGETGHGEAAAASGQPEATAGASGAGAASTPVPPARGTAANPEHSNIAPAATGPAGLAAEEVGRPADVIVAEPANAQTFFSIYFLMTGLHGIHVLGGIGAMFWLLACARRGDFSTGHFTKVDMVALYWHLVDLIWIYLFLLLYLIH
jgi:cytochrome c oxidase subunit 3